MTKPPLLLAVGVILALATAGIVHFALTTHQEIQPWIFFTLGVTLLGRGVTDLITKKPNPSARRAISL
ncbi:MAG: hypothetical protein KatS3mg057_1382 [Herpetosiphonaceae bacterium]|nr:MAG: hypothetical protein KatS3mg057_1382 [Herpetosiphonaceae bacterium]